MTLGVSRMMAHGAHVLSLAKRIDFLARVKGILKMKYDLKLFVF